jgi:hypothetical protein
MARSKSYTKKRQAFAQQTFAQSGIGEGPGFNRNSLSFIAVAVLFVAGFSIMMYYILRAEDEAATTTTTATAEAMIAQKAMQSLDETVTKAPRGVSDPSNIKTMYHSATGEVGKPKVNMGKGPINLEISGDDLKAKNTSVQFDAIKQVTKGDGQIRPIKINGKKVPRPIVQDAMFENQDFMYRTDQFPLKAKANHFDPAKAEPKSQFGPMTFPLNGLAMDVIRRGSTNDNVSISKQGGRFKN